MGQFDYQRTVIAYHGCDESVVAGVLLRGEMLDESKNPYDWLGRGIYFWEHGPQRALEWAKEREQIKRPAVLGAILHLGQCFDLLDTRYTKHLADIFPRFLKRRAQEGRSIPESKSHGRHFLDCAVINWTIDRLEQESGRRFHSVRGIFTEGNEVYPGSNIMAKSHVQIAIRNPEVMIGYFKPSI